MIMDMKAQLQAAAGSKASGKEGSKKPLSPRSVAKILIIGGSVWRFGRRIKMVDGSPFVTYASPERQARALHSGSGGDCQAPRSAERVL